MEQDNSTTQSQSKGDGNLFNAEQLRTLSFLKAHFPFRIVWGGFDANGEFHSGADYTRHRLNAFLRKPGHIVATVE